MTGFDALWEAYQNALKPLSVDQPKVFADSLGQYLTRLNASTDPAERLRLMGELWQQFSPNSPGSPTVAALTGVRDEWLRALNAQLGARPEALSFLEAMRILTRGAEAAYQASVRQEPLATLIANAWRYWPSTPAQAQAQAQSQSEVAAASQRQPEPAPMTKPKPKPKPKAKPKAKPNLKPKLKPKPE
jgi:hypothetical protein